MDLAAAGTATTSRRRSRGRPPAAPNETQRGTPDPYEDKRCGLRYRRRRAQQRAPQHVEGIERLIGEGGVARSKIDDVEAGDVEAIEIDAVERVRSAGRDGHEIP